MRHRGLLYTILAVFGGVLFAGAALVAWLDHRLTLADAEELAHAAAQAYAHQSRQNLAELRFGIEWLAEHIDPDAPELGLSEEEKSTASMIAARLPGLSGLVFVDRIGVLRFATASRDAIGNNMSDREYFKAARDGGRTYYLGPTVQARGTGRLVHTYSLRLVRNDAFAGVILASVRAEEWSGILAPLLRLPNSRIRLIRDDGTVVLNQYRDPATGEIHALTDDALQRDAPGPARHIMARVPIEGYELTVEAAITRAAALAEWRERMIVVVVTGIAGLAALTVFGVFGYQALQRETRAGELIRERTEALEARTSELDRALETQKLLMAELEHRVHNGLTLAASMLSLQKSKVPSDEARDALDEARARILAIARVHERLKGEHNPSSTRLDQYVERLSEDLAANAGVDLHTDADAVSVPTEMAVSIGLILTELILNAAKYGTANGPRVDVVIRSDGGQLAIGVRDYGDGLEDGFTPEATMGLGMRLVTTMAGQINGLLEYENANPGARFVVRMQCSELAAEARTA